MLFYLEFWIHALIFIFLSPSFYLSNIFYSSYYNIGSWEKVRQDRTEKNGGWKKDNVVWSLMRTTVDMFNVTSQPLITLTLTLTIEWY